MARRGGLKLGRYTLVLNLRRNGSPAISFINTGCKTHTLPRNLRGEIPRGNVAGEVTATFQAAETLVDPLEIELQPNQFEVVIRFK